jgi:hypothetical protein
MLLVGWRGLDLFERGVGDVEALLVKRQVGERRRQLQRQRQPSRELVGIDVGVHKQFVILSNQLRGQAVVGVPGLAVGAAAAVVASQHHRQHDAGDHQRHDHGADAPDLHVVRRHPAHFSVHKILQVAN